MEGTRGCVLYRSARRARYILQGRRARAILEGMALEMEVFWGLWGAESTTLWLRTA